MIERQNQNEHLKRTRYFLNLLGNPHKDLKFIHITGTSGKGSVTNMVHEILTASGANVGSFTSPFVTTSIEKIKVKDFYIAPDELADIVEYLKPFIDVMYQHGPYGRPSYFEIFLAMAFVYFKRQNCEWAVLEVGCGGRYDATNIIQRPVVTAITNIDYDHMHILGKTLKEIAYVKAGIIKRGSTFFTAEQRKPLVKIFADICDELKVPLHQIPRQSDYQESNNMLATAIAEHIGIAHPHIEKGLQNARLQCRFEIVQENPLVILDGAHNRAKIQSAVDNLKKLKYNKLYLIFGIAENKDTNLVMPGIISLADKLYLTRFQIKDRRCAHPKELLARARKYLKKGTSTEIFLDPEQALAKALKDAGKDDVVLAVGSFFLAGELRKKWYPEEWILERRKGF